MDVTVFSPKQLWFLTSTRLINLDYLNHFLISYNLNILIWKENNNEAYEYATIVLQFNCLKIDNLIISILQVLKLLYTNFKFLRTSLEKIKFEKNLINFNSNSTVLL